jgi:hypothetical protein
MTEFNLQWTKALLGDIKNEVYAQYFAIVCGERIVFIGEAYHANLHDTIASTFRNFDLDHHQAPEIYLGRLREYGIKRISRDFLSSMHQLLVFVKKPYMNTDGKMCYNGIPDLSLANTGCEDLPGKIRVENRLVFLSKIPAFKPPAFLQPAIAG